jgi:hypothetical protein
MLTRPDGVMSFNLLAIMSKYIVIKFKLGIGGKLLGETMGQGSCTPVEH